MSFVKQFGGTADGKMSGLASLDKALASGLSIRQVEQMAKAQGVTFGAKAQAKINSQRNTFVGNYGGTSDGRGTGLASVQRAMADGLSTQEIQQQVRSQPGGYFGPKAEMFFQQDNLNNMLNAQRDALAAQQAQQQRMLSGITSAFENQLRGLQEALGAQRQTYADNLAQMQETFKIRQAQPQERARVLGIQGAKQSTPQGQAQSSQGIRGSFARKGVRLRSLNV